MASMCPRCCVRMTKSKSLSIYKCRKCGGIRNIASEYPITLREKETKNNA